MTQVAQPLNYFNHPPNGATTIYTIVTGLATAFNVLVILVISFVLMPKVDTAIVETKRNQVAIETNRRIAAESHETLKSIRRDLEDQRSIVRKIGDMLITAEMKAGAMKEKRDEGK